jgi:hypothetical protein
MSRDEEINLAGSMVHFNSYTAIDNVPLGARASSLDLESNSSLKRGYEAPAS